MTVAPGQGEPWRCEPCDAENNDIRKKCRFCKRDRSEVAALEAIVSSPVEDHATAPELYAALQRLAACSPDSAAVELALGVLAKARGEA